MSIDLRALARLDQSFMPDTCEVRVKPVPGSGSDFGGGDDYNDGTWAKLTYTPPVGSATTAIPCRVGTVPSRNPQNVIQGAEATQYTYLVGIPVAMRDTAKPGDHVVWRSNHIEVTEVRDGTFATSVVLVGERLG
jgi:hypothetical protein